ncbi:MAG: DUF4395 family protein [Anaerolineae bacterium]|nr:DUF4395 family protein [Anaerolineae bacterium]
MTSDTLPKVDHAGLKVGQAVTIIALLVGFILNSWIFVAFVAISQFLGAINAPFAPYKLIYTQWLKPAGIIKPHVIPDHPQPHRFAMLVGSIFNGAGTIALLANMSALGWGLVWVVIILANLNFWLNFCAGCWMYYQFNRMGIKGFDKAPIHNS